MKELQQLRDQYFNKPCILSLEDGREVFGQIKCIDSYKQIVLKKVIVSIPQKQVSPVNEFIQYKFNKRLDASITLKEYFPKMAEEQISIIKKNSFSISGAIISIDKIKNIELILIDQQQYKFQSNVLQFK